MMGIKDILSQPGTATATTNGHPDADGGLFRRAMMLLGGVTMAATLATGTPEAQAAAPSTGPAVQEAMVAAAPANEWAAMMEDLATVGERTGFRVKMMAGTDFGAPYQDTANTKAAASTLVEASSKTVFDGLGQATCMVVATAGNVPKNVMLAGLTDLTMSPAEIDASAIDGEVLGAFVTRHEVGHCEAGYGLGLGATVGNAMLRNAADAIQTYGFRFLHEDLLRDFGETVAHGTPEDRQALFKEWSPVLGHAIPLLQKQADNDAVMKSIGYQIELTAQVLAELQDDQLPTVVDKGYGGVPEEIRDVMTSAMRNYNERVAEGSAVASLTARGHEAEVQKIIGLRANAGSVSYQMTETAVAGLEKGRELRAEAEATGRINEDAVNHWAVQEAFSSRLSLKETRVMMADIEKGGFRDAAKDIAAAGIHAVKSDAPVPGYDHADYLAARNSLGDDVRKHYAAAMETGDPTAYGARLMEDSWERLNDTDTANDLAAVRDNATANGLVNGLSPEQSIRNATQKMRGINEMMRMSERVQEKIGVPAAPEVDRDGGFTSKLLDRINDWESRAEHDQTASWEGAEFR